MTDILSEFPELMSTGEVADAFGVDPATVRRWDKAGKIPEGVVSYTLGGNRRYVATWVRERLGLDYSVQR